MTYVFLGCNSKMKTTTVIEIVWLESISLIFDGKKPSLFFERKSFKNGHFLRGTEHISFRIVAKGAHEQLPLGVK